MRRIKRRLISGLLLILISTAILYHTRETGIWNEVTSPIQTIKSLENEINEIADTITDTLSEMEVLPPSGNTSTKESENMQVIQTALEIPAYSGTDVLVINGDIPSFSEGDWNSLQVGEYKLSELDSLERVGTAIIKTSKEYMPTEERGATGNAKPSGWHQNKYPEVIESEPSYLYNRSHLIAWSISGLTDDVRNLMTGTRYFNASLMLTVEVEILQHLDAGETVLYRATPVFDGDNLLATGILMEAQNADKTWQLCRFCYNVQPGVVLNYATGENWLE